MSAFEFFFSFYGLVLGLSVTVIATGVARAFKHRRTVRIGWKTPLLAAFVALDIATFWDTAWNNFAHLPYSYGMLIGGLLVAMVYFVASGLVFPEPEDIVADLDEHLAANKRAVLLLLVAANCLLVLALACASLSKPNSLTIIASYGVNLSLYLILIVPAALTRRGWLYGLTLGLHVALYLAIGVASVIGKGLPTAS